MSFPTAVVLLVVGLLAGWMSGVVMKVGGHGLTTDLALGVAGSLVGAALLHALSSAADAGWLPLITGAVVGAGLLLVVQRMFWQNRPVPTRSRR